MLDTGMNRSLTALFAALEALLVVAIGVAITLLPLTVLWAFQYGLQVDYTVFWHTAVDLWLLGSGVDIRLTLDPALTIGLGFAGAGTPFWITIAPLGFALVTVLLGARAGRRVGETPHRLFGMMVAIITFALLSFGLTLTVLLPAALPSIWQAATLPPLVFALGILIGSELLSPAATGVLGPRGLIRWRPEFRLVLVAALRGGVASASLVIAASAVVVAALFLFNYAAMVTLYESVHAGVLGGAALTVGQLALLPNLVIWAASWMIGPGFALGSGSSVSPVGTTLGPIPAVPVFGALPAPGSWGVGFVGLLVPVLAAFLVATLLRPRLLRELDASHATRFLVAAGLAIGLVGGIALGLLAWASAGSAGPGRLLDVGPAPLLVGGFAALEIGIAATVGLLVSRPTRR